MRTREEIHALGESTFEIRLAGRKRLEVWKRGDPPVFVCAEPMPTLHTFPGKSVAFPVMGPVGILAIAWHLRLTPEEAAVSGYVPETAWTMLQQHIHDECDRLGVARLQLERIEPDDPRWGRP